MSTQRSRHFILDDAGNVVPCDLMTWAQWFEAGDERRVVEQTRLPNDVLVSTVFLGVDHRIFGQGPPLIWETMAFDPDGHESETRRYSTREEAVAGHAEMVSAALNAKESR